MKRSCLVPQLLFGASTDVLNALKVKMGVCLGEILVLCVARVCVCETFIHLNAFLDLFITNKM